MNSHIVPLYPATHKAHRHTLSTSTLETVSTLEHRTDLTLSPCILQHTRHTLLLSVLQLLKLNTKIQEKDLATHPGHSHRLPGQCSHSAPGKFHHSDTESSHYGTGWWYHSKCPGRVHHSWPKKKSNRALCIKEVHHQVHSDIMPFSAMASWKSCSQHSKVCSTICPENTRSGGSRKWESQMISGAS